MLQGPGFSPVALSFHTGSQVMGWQTLQHRVRQEGQFPVESNLLCKRPLQVNTNMNIAIWQ